jgi:diaminopimelate decarboxylase
MLDANKLLEIGKKVGTPAYIYDADDINRKCRELKKNLPGVNLYYACKANTNKDIVKMIYKNGFSIETVSPGEIAIARRAGVPTSRITFTCGNITEKELISVARLGIRIYLDSLHQVEIFGKNFPGREISVRLNLRVGGGHHSHVITGGMNSKFGIDVSDLDELRKIASKYDLKIAGLHQHIGSNVLSASLLLKGIRAMIDTAYKFPDLKYLDFGGGFGVTYSPNDKTLDIKILGKNFERLADLFTKKYGRKLIMSFEPGRYVVAESGRLLVTVTDIKRNPRRTFIGVNSGINHLIRPAMYDSHHAILNLSNPKSKKEVVDVVGNICESGDFFAKSRLLSKARLGDILSIENSGAYGYVMASNYNSREKPKEYLVTGNQIRKI